MQATPTREAPWFQPGLDLAQAPDSAAKKMADNLTCITNAINALSEGIKTATPDMNIPFLMYKRLLWQRCLADHGRGIISTVLIDTTGEEEKILGTIRLVLDGIEKNDRVNLSDIHAVCSSYLAAAILHCRSQHTFEPKKLKALQRIDFGSVKSAKNIKKFVFKLAAVLCYNTEYKDIMIELEQKRTRIFTPYWNDGTATIFKNGNQFDILESQPMTQRLSRIQREMSESGQSALSAEPLRRRETTTVLTTQVIDAGLQASRQAQTSAQDLNPHQRKVRNWRGTTIWHRRAESKSGFEYETSEISSYGAPQNQEQWNKINFPLSAAPHPRQNLSEGVVESKGSPILTGTPITPTKKLVLGFILNISATKERVAVRKLNDLLPHQKSTATSAAPSHTLPNFSLIRLELSATGPVNCVAGAAVQDEGKAQLIQLYQEFCSFDIKRDNARIVECSKHTEAWAAATRIKMYADHAHKIDSYRARLAMIRDIMKVVTYINAYVDEVNALLSEPVASKIDLSVFCMSGKDRSGVAVAIWAQAVLGIAEDSPQAFAIKSHVQHEAGVVGASPGAHGLKAPEFRSGGEDLNTKWGGGQMSTGKKAALVTAGLVLLGVGFILANVFTAGAVSAAVGVAAVAYAAYMGGTAAAISATLGGFLVLGILGIQLKKWRNAAQVKAVKKEALLFKTVGLESEKMPLLQPRDSSPTPTQGTYGPL